MRCRVLVDQENNPDPTERMICFDNDLSEEKIKKVIES